MAGLAPATIRQLPDDTPSAIGPDITVDVSDDTPADMPEVDQKGNILSIEHGDGSVTVSLDGKPLVAANRNKPSGWFANLCEDMDDAELNRISTDLLRGIDDDIRSRTDWIESRTNGLILLGLKVEIPGIQGASDGAPVEGMSRVRHPLLLEAVLRFQANARSELLPTDGPVKVRNDDNNASFQEDQLANALERDLNHYLTAVAKEYYPDTDRMLLMLGFGGSAFKKVYFCPLRNRPVSETIDADDLIVNQDATDLSNAKRVTHRTMLRPSTVKRLQILGVYQDVDLSTANAPKLDSYQREEKAQQGISPDTNNPEDRDREIYECYCELDIKGFEHKQGGEPSGLEVPYRVTIDVSSQKILSITRNFDKKDTGLPEARQTFVKYTFVPGIGFYDIGLLNILGNTTNAITAAWRELLDAGMYSNFPGFLITKTGARQDTNLMRVPPGGAAEINTGGLDISKAVMPLPYKEPSQALMALVTDMANTGMRIGGTSEQQVGEGRADAPVGTTLAMIEQATKVLNAVHKRMHAAQANEFQLLVNVFKEHPESFWERPGKNAYPWDEATFLKAIDTYDLVPQADPNTASHSQRVMKIMALKQLQAASPELYDAMAIDTAALQTIGWSNPSQFFKPADQMGQPSPEVQKEEAKLAIAKQDADTRQQVGLGKLQVDKDKLQLDAHAALGEDGRQVDTPVDHMNAVAKLEDAKTKRQALGLQQHDVHLEAESRDLDRASREKIAAIGIARDVLTHPFTAPGAAKEVKPVEREVGAEPSP